MYKAYTFRMYPSDLDKDRDINASINILEEGIFKYYKEQYAS